MVKISTPFNVKLFNCTIKKNALLAVVRVIRWASFSTSFLGQFINVKIGPNNLGLVVYLIRTWSLRLSITLINMVDPAVPAWLEMVHILVILCILLITLCIF